MAAMMAAAIGVAALGGLASLYQAEKARKASKERLDEIERMFEDLRPPDFDMSIMDPPELIQEELESVDYDMSNLTPEKYEIVKKFAPEVEAYVEEKAPELLEDTEAGQAGQQAQLSALRRLRGIADSRFDPRLQQELNVASRRAQMEAQSSRESALQDFARRRMLGSGAQMAAELQGDQDSMERLALTSQDAAGRAYENRLRALRDSATLGGDIRSQELGKEKTNIDIINDFNQRSSRRFQDYLSRAADRRNQATIRNLEREEQVSDMNVDEANRFNVLNRQRQDDLLTRQREQKFRERGYLNQLAQQQAAFKQAERNQVNALQNMRFNADLAKKQGLMGIGGQQVQNIMQNAADRNQAIQGFTGAVGSGFEQQSRIDAQDRAQDRQDRRLYYEMAMNDPRREGRPIRKPRRGEFGYVD